MKLIPAVLVVTTMATRHDKRPTILVERYNFESMGDALEASQKFHTAQEKGAFDVPSHFKMVITTLVLEHVLT